MCAVNMITNPNPVYSQLRDNTKYSENRHDTLKRKTCGDMLRNSYTYNLLMAKNSLLW
jgi:hypothetical protein